MAVQVIDRPILKYLTDDATVGIYQANYRLGIFRMMAVNMFDAAWRPFFLQRAADDAGRQVLARVMTYFVAAAGLLLLFLGLFIPQIVSLPLMGGRPLINPVYWAGLPIVPVVTLGYLFNGIYVNLLAPATLAKRSELVAYATGLGAAVNVATNLLWIPRWGMMGAAAATLAAYAAMAGSLYLMSRKVYPIAYEGGRLLRVAGCLAAVGLAARAIGLDFSPDRAAARLLLLLAFPVLLAFSGFCDEGEISALKGLWGGSGPKAR
jgi:O-antigen/teichoic acid export membrane protein